MFVGAAVAWSYVPERIPVHWNLQGEVDGYGGKFVGLLLLPLMTLGLYLLLLFLPRLDPGYAQLPELRRRLQRHSHFALVVFMAVLYGVTAAGGAGPIRSTSARWSRWASGASLVVLGNVMGKIRPNWFVGVRTPWTLSSKLSWTKTHRLAGWLFIVLGPLIAASGVLRTDWMLGLTIAVGGVSLVWIVAYSYVVWRKDPTRTTPAGTSPSVE